MSLSSDHHINIEKAIGAESTKFKEEIKYNPGMLYTANLSSKCKDNRKKFSDMHGFRKHEPTSPF